MSDVAALSGVSTKTVSRVVNGERNVSADTVSRVTAAIDQLGFRPNEHARQLRHGSTTTIGLVLEDVGDPFYATLARAVEEVAFHQDYTLLASSSAGDPERAGRVVESFTARGVNGIVVTPAIRMSSEVLRAAIQTGCAVVLIDRPLENLDTDTVLVDNRGGALEGTRHLIRHGHTRIAYFGDVHAVFTATERRDGYLAALHAAGIAVDDGLIVMASPADAPIDELVDRVLTLDEPPTAILSGNNRWTVGLLRSLRERIDDFALVGFDDFELGDVLKPGVTVVAQDPAAMGRIAAELLFRRIDGDDSPPQRIQLGTVLIPRGSGERVITLDRGVPTGG
jgi:LacI family transcriptional regulator